MNNTKEFKTKVFKKIVESLKQDENGKYLDDSLDNAVEQQLKNSSDDINKEDENLIKNLSSEYANLVNRFSSLVDVKNLLLKKVLNHAVTNFDRDTAKKVRDMLEDQYDLSLKEKEQIVPPNAVGAGNSPSGT